jgi:molybdopterin synthase sulfur carrier subunit
VAGEIELWPEGEALAGGAARVTGGPAGVTGAALSRAAGPAAADAGPTLGSVLDALEAAYPMLRGTIRDPATGRRRPFIRFYACETDLSHSPPGAPLPGPVTSGAEPLYVVGAMAGG